MSVQGSAGESSFDALLHGGRADAPEPGLIVALAPHLASEDLLWAVRLLLAGWQEFFQGRAIGDDAARVLGARLAEFDPDDPFFRGPGLARLAEQAPPDAVRRMLELLLDQPWTTLDQLAALAAALPGDWPRPLVDEVVRLSPPSREWEMSGETPLTLARVARVLGPAAEHEALAVARADSTSAGALALAELALQRPELMDEAVGRLDELSDSVRTDVARRLGVETSDPVGPAPPPEGILAALDAHLAAQPPETRAQLARSALHEVLNTWGGGLFAMAAPPEDIDGGEDAAEPAPEPEATGVFELPNQPLPRNAGNTLAEPEAESPRYVNVGIARRDGRTLGSALTLACGRSYLVALSIGDLLVGRAGGKPERLPDELLPDDAELTVVLYAPRGGLVLDEKARTGAFRLRGHAVDVLRSPIDAPADPDWANALWFPVLAPDSPGSAPVRLSLFCQATLVQSVFVEARVEETEQAESDAVTAVIDFTLTRSLRPESVKALAGDSFSVLVNRTGDDANLYLQGAPGGPLTATIDGQQIEGLIQNARGALRRAAWGTADEWRSGIDGYRYVVGDRARLVADLEQLAVAGFSIYDVVIDAFAERPAQRELQEALLIPAQLQIASKDDPRFVIPAAMLYDRPRFLDQLDHTICDGFLAALDAPEPLDVAPCFNGHCPTVAEPTVICPSGFWGFRHSLGMPISVAGDAPATIAVDGEPIVVAGASTDKLLTLRAAHIDRVHGLRVPVDWRYSEVTDDVLRTLEEVSPALVYLFCHGGLTPDNRPYIRIGADDGKAITRAMLRYLVWPDGGPLVFINGCHTTAVSPEQAINLVSGFLAAGAAGVIGTEITVLQELAVPFAEAFLRRFLHDRQALGAAIRGARLDLLKQGNPLGLAYIPFASAGIQLAA